MNTINFEHNNMFYEMGYTNILNENNNKMYFEKKTNETEYFELKKVNNKYHVSFPLKKSVFQYTSKFADYVDAYDYLMKQFIYFNDLDRAV